MSLTFEVFSGGSVTIDHVVCATCETKACVAACQAPSLGSVLVLQDGLPALAVTAEQAKRGACIECLACDLACRSDGAGGLQFVLPMPALDAILAEDASW
jgi:succinyl-CoA synthetase beta subunit